jgi:hypothetical protein
MGGLRNDTVTAQLELVDVVRQTRLYSSNLVAIINDDRALVASHFASLGEIIFNYMILYWYIELCDK